MSYNTELSFYKVWGNLDNNMAGIVHQDKAGADETGPFDAPKGRWRYSDGTGRDTDDAWPIDDTIKVYRTTS